MAATYVNIPKSDMEAFLTPQGFVPMFLPGTVELVYGKRVDTSGMKYSLRVYTGINPTGESREVGSDAIRVEVWWKDKDNDIHRAGGSKRVHRVAGWRKNLAQRIDEWEESLNAACEGCGAPTKEIDGKNGKFFGCVMYRKTGCRGKRRSIPLNEDTCGRGTSITPGRS